MKYATLSQLSEIYSHFQSQRDVFGHVRKDRLTKRINTEHCIYQDGVLITFQQYERAGKIVAACPQIRVQAGEWVIHQLLNTQQGNGAGGRMLWKFMNEV